MTAMLLTLSIFVFWSLAGLAILTLFNTRIRMLQRLLISPSVGMAATVLPIFFINRVGVPVKNFGVDLFIVILIVSILCLVIRRPKYRVTQIIPHLSIIVAALLLAAHPMLHYGFDWVSFSNDDMANYTLAAQRFLNHGYFDEPNLKNLFTGKDYSSAYWFMHVGSGVRAGSELMLATIWTVTGLNAHQIFMPVIMGLHLVLIASVGAMVAGAIYSKRSSIIAMVLMAVSPLTTLGALYQLIGQVGGLALLSSAITLMYRPFPSKSAIKIVYGSVPVVLILTALFVWYPEVLPFFGLGWLIYVVMVFREKRHDLTNVIIPAIYAGTLVLLVLNSYMITALTFMLGQASGGMQSADLTTLLFPYFLVPSGVAAFWGLIPIGEHIPEPFLSMVIAVGLGLFYILLRHTIPRQLKLVSVPISMLLLMVLVGFLLFFRNNDFGIFKLAMFAQPFLVGVLAIELSRLSLWNLSATKKAFVIVLLLCLGSTQFSYVQKSTGEFFGGLNEIPRASSQKVNKQFQTFFDDIRGESFAGYVADTSNVVLAKFQSLYTQGDSIIFPSRGFFSAIQKMHYTENLSAFANSEAYTARFADLIGSEYQDERQIKTNSGDNKFLVYKDGYETIMRRVLLTAVEKQTIFNSSKYRFNDGYFRLIEDPINHLIFVHSSLGNHYYLGDRRKVAFYQLEDDPMFPGQRVSALGEHLLFMVMGFKKDSRMVVEITDTVLKQFGSELPNPKVQNNTLKFVGRGSGRLFSDPITPALIDGMPFVSIDMARSAQQFPNTKSGLMLLFGRDIPIDNRRITAFGRDISLLSTEDFEAQKSPAALSKFPSDLANKSLEYSGIYEDGWISEKSFFVLSPSVTSKFITVIGSIPHIDDPTFSTVLKLNVNGREVASKDLLVGDFEFKVPVTSQAPKQRIELVFSKYQTLPGADGRIAAANINFIGFE